MLDKYDILHISKLLPLLPHQRPPVDRHPPAGPGHYPPGPAPYAGDGPGPYDPSRYSHHAPGQAGLPVPQMYGKCYVQTSFISM